MLKECLLELVTLARLSCKPSVLHPDPEPKHLYRIVGADGGISELIEARPSDRSYSAASLDDLADLVKRRIKQGVRPADVLVFCGRGGVRVSIDEPAGRREWSRIDLPISHEFKTLQELEAKRPAMTHRELLQRLRIDLAGAVDPSDLAKFRSLRFKSAAQTASTKTVAQDSLGRDVMHELLCDGVPPPEELILNTCVYRDLVAPAHRMVVRAAVDTDLATATIAIIPLAGELERAHRETNLWIQERLIELLGTDVDVICGQPAGVNDLGTICALPRTT